MKRLLLLLFMFYIPAAMAQVSPQIQGAGTPSSPCFNGGQEYVDTTNHLIYSCPSNGANWVLRGLGNLAPNAVATSGSGAPAGNCNSTSTYYVNTANGDFYTCPTPGSAWTKAGNVAGGGTVTSVTGTLPINSSGGNTPAISLDSTGIAAMCAYAADSGSANAMAVTVPSWWPAAAVAGMCLRVKANASATGSTTIIVTPSGGSAYASANIVKRITTGTANPGATGDIISGGMYEIQYDGSNWVLQGTSSAVYTGGALTTQGVLTGNSANQIAGSSTMLMTGGVFTKMNNETIAGNGVAYIRGVTSQKAETNSADASVLAVTPAAAIGTYRVNCTASVSSATSGVIGFTLSYTDSNGNAQSNIALSLLQGGTAAPANTFTTSAAGNYSCIPYDFDVNTGAAAITLKWVGGGTSAAKVSGAIERIQ